MNLAGQGAPVPPSRSVQKLDDGGYIMVVLLIGMAVSAVWMSAMLPSWRQQAVRQKEAELIFRGEEYARAIALYWRKNNQTLPPSIDVLISQRYLRKKYVDPITNKEFLTVGGLGPGLSPSPTPSSSRGGAAIGPPSSTGMLGQSQMGVRAGISGVRSTSTATSIVVYRGQTSYSQFPFDYVIALQKMGGAAPPQSNEDPTAGRGRRGGAGGPTRIEDRVSPGGGPARGGEMAPIMPGGGRGMGTLPATPGRGR